MFLENKEINKKIILKITLFNKKLSRKKKN